MLDAKTAEKSVTAVVLDSLREWLPYAVLIGLALLISVGRALRIWVEVPAWVYLLYFPALAIVVAVAGAGVVIKEFRDAARAQAKRAKERRGKAQA